MKTGNTLYVRNLDTSLRHEDVQDVFARFGRIKEVVIPLDYYTRSPKGFAFVEFEDGRDAEDAHKELDKTRLGGKELEIEFARGERKTPSEMIARQRNARDRDFGDSRGRFSRYEPRGRGSFHHHDDYQRRRSPPRRDRFNDRDRFEPRGDRYNDRHADRERRNDRYEPVRDRSPVARERPDRDRFADRPVSDRLVDRYDRAPRQRDHIPSTDRNGDRAPPPRDREEPERSRADRYAPVEESDDLHESRGRDRRY